MRVKAIDKDYVIAPFYWSREKLTPKTKMYIRLFARSHRTAFDKVWIYKNNEDCN